MVHQVNMEWVNLNTLSLFFRFYSKILDAASLNYYAYTLAVEQIASLCNIVFTTGSPLSLRSFLKKYKPCLKNKQKIYTNYPTIIAEYPFNVDMVLNFILWFTSHPIKDTPADYSSIRKRKIKILQHFLNSSQLITYIKGSLKLFFCYTNSSSEGLFLDSDIIQSIRLYRMAMIGAIKNKNASLNGNEYITPLCEIKNISTLNLKKIFVPIQAIQSDSSIEFYLYHKTGYPQILIPLTYNDYDDIFDQIRYSLLSLQISLKQKLTITIDLLQWILDNNKKNFRTK